ncbi:MAG: PIN domain-containing protein [Burkholderiales bacterium]|nr:PIN domain-containing protein [Burkholderiales bacterium]
MSAAFFDTNVLLYLLSADDEKANRAEQLLMTGGVVSVQVLNEFASVATRKLAMPWKEIDDVLQAVRALCVVQPLTIETHERGLAIAQRYRLAVYDAMIAASALLADCVVLYSEDFQDGRRIEKTLVIRNPFTARR